MTDTYDLPEVSWKDEGEISGVRVGPVAINGNRLTRSATDNTPQWLPRETALAIARALDANFFQS